MPPPRDRQPAPTYWDAAVYLDGVPVRRATAALALAAAGLPDAALAWGLAAFERCRDERGRWSSSCGGGAAAESAAGGRGRPDIDKTVGRVAEQAADVLATPPELAAPPELGTVWPGDEAAVRAAAGRVADWGHTFTGLVSGVAAGLLHVGDHVLAAANPLSWLAGLVKWLHPRDPVTGKNTMQQEMDAQRLWMHNDLKSRYGETASNLIHATGSVVGMLGMAATVSAAATAAPGILVGAAVGSTLPLVASLPLGRAILALPAIVLAEGVRQTVGTVGAIGRLFAGAGTTPATPPPLPATRPVPPPLPALPAGARAPRKRRRKKAGFAAAAPAAALDWATVHREARRLYDGLTDTFVAGLVKAGMPQAVAAALRPQRGRPS